MNANSTVMLGIDIGGTTTSFGLVRQDGSCTAQTTMATQGADPAERLVQRVADEVRRMLRVQPPGSALLGIGIGAPNANYYTGMIINPPNLAWDSPVNLKLLFRQQLDLPTVITNDANAAALGELLYGAGRGLRHFIAVTLGTGLGSGIIVNGALLYGADGYAGELGHTVVDPAGRQCGCGKRGCLETYVSAQGICRTVHALLAERADESVLRSVSYHQLTSQAVYAAAQAGDPLARAAFTVTGQTLGVKLADAVAMTNPEAFIVSGGLAAAGELLLDPARQSMERNLLKLFRGRVRLLQSPLPDGLSGMLGAAALAWNELGDPGRLPRQATLTQQKI